MSNPLKKLIAPRLPSAAIGLSSQGASAVALDRRRDMFAVQRAGYVPLAQDLLRPSFDESNITNAVELTDILSELVASVGLVKHRRWSVALPEAATRTAILTLESATASRAETEEMLNWKTERAMAAPVDELRVSRERLRPDAQGRVRYLVTATRLSVLAEYESVFESLGWHAGLILPRHMGEAWWLMREGAANLRRSDALLVSGHGEGFTAVILRGSEPLLVRNVICDTEDRTDELYRFLLFYRDRIIAPPDDYEAAEASTAESIGQLLVAGYGLEATEASAVIEETLAATPHLISAGDLRLSFPSDEIDFQLIAAPAGLASLAWA